MNQITMRRFSSALDLLGRFADIFRGPSIVMAFRRIHPRLREKIMLAVSVANNCYG